MQRLSSAAVRNAKPGWHADGGGLYLQVTTGKKDGQINKSWVFCYALNKLSARWGLAASTPSASAKRGRKPGDGAACCKKGETLSKSETPSGQCRRRSLHAFSRIVQVDIAV
jgi:hypothetical protein